MDDCLFCKIAKKEIPADIVYESDGAVVFLDIKPVSKGHALVIPKAHSQDVLGADFASIASIMAAVRITAKAVIIATGAAGFNLGVNTGAAAGQVVFHTHFHIIPRFNSDGLKPWPHLDSEPKSRAEMAAEIKKFL